MSRIALIFVAFMLSLPSLAQTPWTEKLKVGGDLRLRHDYNSKNRLNDEAGSHKERLRLRLNVQAQVNESLKARIRIATAEGQSPTSTNQTFTDNADKKGIYVDMGFIEWTPAEGHLLAAGKMENPLHVLGASQLLFDSDYTPEGAAYRGQFGNVFARAGGFVIQERAPQAGSGTSEPDSWLLAGVAGFKSELGEKAALTVAAGYHNFTALKKNAALSNFFGNTSEGAGAAARYAHDYQIGQLLAELSYKTDGGIFRLYADFLNNFYLEEENMGYLAGLTFQTLNEDEKPVWTFGYAYQSTETDATVSALNNSDFANGQDGSFGHIFQVGRTVAANTTLSLVWNNAHIDNRGNPYVNDRATFDLQVAF